MAERQQWLPKVPTMIHSMDAPIHNINKGGNFQICFSSNGLFKLGIYNPPRYHRKMWSYRGENPFVVLKKPRLFTGQEIPLLKFWYQQSAHSNLYLINSITLPFLVCCQWKPFTGARKKAQPWSFRLGHPNLISPCWHISFAYSCNAVMLSVPWYLKAKWPPIIFWHKGVQTWNEEP